MRSWVAAKIHGLQVTRSNVAYHGSVTIGQALLTAAGIQPYEQVHVVNLETGARWITYALPGEGMVFETNGGGAHLAKPGDRCVVMTFVQSETFEGAAVLMMDEAWSAPNHGYEVLAYPMAELLLPV